MGFIVEDAHGSPMVLVATWPGEAEVLRVDVGTHRFRYRPLGAEQEFDFVFSGEDFWAYRGAGSAFEPTDRTLSRIRWLRSALGLSPSRIFTSPVCPNDPDLFPLEAPIPPPDDPVLAPLVARADAIVAEAKARLFEITGHEFEKGPREEELAVLLDEIRKQVQLKGGYLEFRRLPSWMQVQKRKPYEPILGSFFDARGTEDRILWSKAGSPSELLACLRSGDTLGGLSHRSVVLLHASEVDAWIVSHSEVGELLAPEAVHLFRMLGESPPQLLPWDEVLAWASSQ